MLRVNVRAGVAAALFVAAPAAWWLGVLALDAGNGFRVAAWLGPQAAAALVTLQCSGIALVAHRLHLRGLADALMLSLPLWPFLLLLWSASALSAGKLVITQLAAVLLAFGASLLARQSGGAANHVAAIAGLVVAAAILSQAQVLYRWLLA